jgi:Ca2+/H+ antiporter, TMEM165/GDT1 family
VIVVGLVLHHPLAQLPETHLKYLVGLVLSSFGVFFAAEGLGVAWPGSDVALLYLVAAFFLISQAHVRVLIYERRAAVAA